MSFQPGSTTDSNRAEKDVSPVFSQVQSLFNQRLLKAQLTRYVSFQICRDTYFCIFISVFVFLYLYFCICMILSPSVTVPLGQDFTFRAVSPSSSLPTGNLFPPGLNWIIRLVLDRDQCKQNRNWLCLCIHISLCLSCHFQIKVFASRFYHFLRCIGGFCSSGCLLAFSSVIEKNCLSSTFLSLLPPPTKFTSGLLSE